MEFTADGFSELLYFGKVGREGTMVVRHVFNTVPVKYSVDKSGETYVKHYEPKDYVVSVLCIGSEGKPLHNYSYVRFVEVVPRKNSERRLRAVGAGRRQTSTEQLNAGRWGRKRLRNVMQNSNN